LTGGCGSAWTTAYNSRSYPTLEAREANISGTDKGTCGPNPAYKDPPAR